MFPALGGPLTSASGMEAHPKSETVNPREKQVWRSYLVGLLAGETRDASRVELAPLVLTLDASLVLQQVEVAAVNLL